MPEPQNEAYPHAIVYDFEAYLDKTKARSPTAHLTLENEHTPISVSIGDTLRTKPKHICDRDQQQLVEAFVCELERRGRYLRHQVRERFLPQDLEYLPRKQQKRITEWCEQVPVLGFNSGKYDLNLIKQHFVSAIADTTVKVKVAKKANQTMFLLTPHFRFLDVMNYLGPGTSYEKWVKAYGCKLQKSWCPYEWFDSPAKLQYPGLPEYPAWYSKQRGKFPLSLEEWRSCKCTFRERGMRTFADWLRYYNDLDVEPFIEALTKMRGFYQERGVDILKDAVSLPGVSLQFLLRGTLKGENPPELYAPGKEAYDMLKASVTGGPSIVFTRYHEAGVTRIRSHEFKDARPCRKVIGYDANALYLSTMAKEMPCGKERVTHYEDPRRAVKGFIHRLRRGTWFGFAEVDVRVPENLREKYAEMGPLFLNREVPEEAVPEKMLDYLKRTGRKRINSRKLVGAMTADKILLYAPMLSWYVDHGLQVTAVHRTIDYKPQKTFEWFVEQVTEARRTGDTDKEKAIFAEVCKLLGNSAYGKLIEALERQSNVTYSKDEKVVDRAMRSAWFDAAGYEEIGDTYELHSRKPQIRIKRPFQVGIAVYQLAKLRMLEFYYDFLDKYVDRRDFELIQMDTDSMYMALSTATLDQAVRPELQQEFQAHRREWLAWDTRSNRTPGIFKLEFQGSRAIALCSKCYYADAGTGGASKASAKGMSKRHNDITWARYLSALHAYQEGTTESETIARAQNRGFRMVNGQMVTYQQDKLGLSAYYDKRRVLDDGTHTVPID